MIESEFSLFVTLLAIMNPLGNAAIFVSLAQGITRSDMVNLAVKTGIASFVVLIISALIGLPLLHAIGVTMSAFRFAGGLILLKVGFSMFNGQSDNSHYTPEEHDAEMSNMAVTPLTIPLIAGPGAMVTVIHFVNKLHSFSVVNLTYLTIVLAINCLCVTACLYATTLDFFQVVLRKKSVIGIVTRISGLLIISIAASMLLSSVQHYLT